MVKQAPLWVEQQAYFLAKANNFRMPRLLDGKCTCEKSTFADMPLNMYPHTGGWNIAEINKKQWLFFTCPSCGYQWSIWKIGVPKTHFFQDNFDQESYPEEKYKNGGHY